MEEKKLRDFSFMRIDSCVSSPQKEILNAFDSQDLSSFVDRLYDDELNTNYEYPDRNFSSLLHLCVAGGHAEFTRELLRNKGTNPNQSHKVLQKYPLHVAVEQGSVVLVKSLLQAGADVNAKMADGSTALHIAALRSAARFVKDGGQVAKLEMQKNFSVIMGLLLSAGPVNVDAKNNTSGATPLYFAVDKGTEDVARQLLSKGACVNIEVDGETVEEKIEESMPGLLSMGLSFNQIDTDAIENQLFHCLYLDPHNADNFMQKWEEAEHNNNLVNVNADNGMYTFLQYASDQGADKLVEFLLLDKKANPDLCTKNYRIPPLVLAGHHGYYKVIKVFLKAATLGLGVDFTVKDNKGENVLHRCVKKESKTSIQNEYRDYDLCLDILLDDKLGVRKAILPAVNATDQMGNTALHFAAFLGNQNAVRKLLRSESNIGIKNKKMERAISFISPSIMEEFLDSCLQDYGLISDEQFKLEFKYSFLGPPYCQPNDQSKEASGDIDDDDTNTLELTEKLTAEQSSTNTSFVGDLPEAEPLWYLAQTAHRPLLSHPVITSFLCLKWRRIRTYYYANLFFYTIFLSLLTSYLVLGAIQEDSIGLRMTTLACTGALILRELFQALVSPRRYFFNMENVLEIVMLTFSVYLTKSPLDVQNQHHRNMAATAILCSWMEFFLLLGRHPKLSTFITMFFTVSLKFLMFLTWYISIIIAFGFAFFFILSQQDGNDYFKNPDKSILKTVVMSLTGELEFEGIDFGLESNGAVFGKFVFLFYIFFIMLVLVNLLNGLAVSDITEIQKEAEIVSLNSRVDLIVFIESMLLGDPFHFLTNWPPFAWGRKLPSCDCFSSVYKLGPIRWILTHSMGSTLLFNKRLLNKKAVFLPNQSRREQSKLPGSEGLGEADRSNENDNLILDDDIIESAKSLLVKKQETLVVSRLKQMEKSLLLLNKQQNLIIEMLNNMNVNSGS